ncbi:hypothetical protein [Paenibacillus alvei]|uniref:hypothetical protein n=1 Tax=Paenibacillus alvei TaxID=44250 RepID=UPI0022824995|nr:hypothetical protein [Paenibacillus alvei]
MNGIGAKEWTLLLSGTVLGIVAGMIQGWVLFLNKRGQMGSGKMKLWIVGTLIVFVALKVTINISFPSYLATSENGTESSHDGSFFHWFLQSTTLYSRIRAFASLLSDVYTAHN